MLESNENRNCGCANNNSNCSTCNMNYENGIASSRNEMMNCNCDYDAPQGINAAFGYNTVDMVENNNECNCNTKSDNEKQKVREEMMHKIKSLNFAIIELGLYLNTHNDDQKALCLHKEYTRQLKELKEQYQRIYGPLSIYYPCKKWRWLEEPWPWEGGVN